MKPALIRLAMPKTKFGIGILFALTGLAARLRLPELFARFSSDDNDRDGAWRLPAYSELNLVPHFAHLR